MTARQVAHSTKSVEMRGKRQAGSVTMASLLRTWERAVRVNFSRRHESDDYRDNVRPAVAMLRKLRSV